MPHLPLARRLPPLRQSRIMEQIIDIVYVPALWGTLISLAHLFITHTYMQTHTSVTELLMESLTWENHYLLVLLLITDAFCCLLGVIDGTERLIRAAEQVERKYSTVKYSPVLFSLPAGKAADECRDNCCVVIFCFWWMVLQAYRSSICPRWNYYHHCHLSK